MSSFSLFNALKKVSHDHNGSRLILVCVVSGLSTNHLGEQLLSCRSLLGGSLFNNGSCFLNGSLFLLGSVL